MSKGSPKQERKSQYQSSKYLDERSLKRFTITAAIKTVSTDNYNEDSIFKAVEEQDVDQCFAIALQYALVGMGKKAYGSVDIDGTIYKTQELLDANQISYDNLQNARLQEDTLTIKRLARVFRFQIRDHIRKTKQASYLYRKYCTIDCLPEFVFPGAEHLIELGQEAGLLNAYANLDKLHGTNFTARITQVLVSRKIFSAITI